ncbi:MAG: HNH endonuclease signature motif containing protein [Maricaulis sp.]|nr:HNH endonuclease signature motif containing protein [Maricaulis sp.]
MITLEHLQIFEKYMNAPVHAFSSGHVTDADKERYWELYRWLIDPAKLVTDRADGFSTYTSRLSQFGGVQGQRLKDMWASIINDGAGAFGRYPQVFAIANQRGIEVGFSIAIHEDDYYDKEVKLRVRAMLPSLYKKLPSPTSPLVSSIDDQLDPSIWKVGIRHRAGFDIEFESAEELVAFQSSDQAGLKGGGTIVRVFDQAQVLVPGFDLEAELQTAFDIFKPLMKQLTPSGADGHFVQGQYQLDKEISEIPQFNPEDDTDAKSYVLKKLAQHLGQQAFRQKLLEAYGGRCAVTGTSEVSSLQAAHIVPYNGKKTNHVSNGILLRADIHNLFDMGLLYIEPASGFIVVSPRVRCPTYRALHGKKAAMPSNAHHAPSVQSLEIQKDKYNDIHE